ncbi:adhesion G protein-coupled receptor E2-like isoform X2 [Mobula birostris]|uniref:adhesion G protein-coupled receptor E2-like isoform X2 n=1 Tax=Mobula birostris TaxID=1983395 RepID=UPI003B28246C
MSSCLLLLVILCCGMFQDILSQNHNCQPGHRFEPSQNKCFDIDECENVAICGPRKSCWNTAGSYRCQCKQGYNAVNQDCEDIDECTSTLCAQEATCQNTDGSFKCICSTGFQSTEKAGSSGRRSCEDIDECKSTSCHKHATCINVMGSYQCNCNTGFQASPATTNLTPGKVCEDIDECESSPCHQLATCNNTLGSYQCNCVAGYQASTATLNLTAGKVCEDIDECKSSPCHKHATCINTVGSYQCNCSTGFQELPATSNLVAGKVCEDIDECESSPCHQLATCNNTLGSYQCNCVAGYQASTVTVSLTAGKVCEDIDECKSSPCHKHATCINTMGSYQCNCSTGFRELPATSNLMAGKVCEDIDECKSSPCHEHATCNNVMGSYQCNCNTGLQALPATANLTAGKICKDVDECQDKNACGVNMTCRNSFGSFYCVCKAGYHQKQGDTQLACAVDPLSCPDSEKQNSTLSQCNLDYSANSQQLNSANDVLKLADCYRDKICQNFSRKNDTKDLTTFVNNVLNSSWLDSMDNTQKLKVASATVDLLENMAMAIALKQNTSKPHTIETSSFVLKVMVPERNTASVDQLVKLETQNNSFEIDWRTIAGGNNTEFQAISFIVFKDLESQLNQEIRPSQNQGGRPSQNYVSLNSKVIAATISNKATSSNLTEKFNLTLNLKQEKEVGKEPECVYWSNTKEKSVWLSDGCERIHSNQTHVTCQCNHLTSFAILMAPVKIETDDWHLEMITYVGLIISLFCLAASIAIFVNCKSIQNANTNLHKHLSITLFLAQFVFLIGMRIKQPVVCALIAGCLHYLFLAVFVWMFLDSLQLFIMSRNLKVTNFTRTHIIKRRYLYVSAYAVPAVIVTISAAINPGGYGTETTCWLKHESGFNWSFQGPVCFVILVNTVLLFATLYLLRRHLNSRNKEVSKLKETKSLTIKAAARMFVLGCTWSFGIFQVDKSTAVFSHLFTVINSLQGLFVFLIYCVFNHRVVNEFRKWLTSKQKSITTESSQMEMNMSETYRTTQSEGSKTQ